MDLTTVESINNYCKRNPIFQPQGNHLYCIACKRAYPYSREDSFNNVNKHKRTNKHLRNIKIYDTLLKMPTITVPNQPSPSLLDEKVNCNDPGQNYTEEEIRNCFNKKSEKSNEEFIQLLNGYRDCLLSYTKNCMCYQNYLQKSKLNDLEIKYKQIFVNNKRKNEEFISEPTRIQTIESKNSKTVNSDTFQYITKSLRTSESFKTLESICRRDVNIDDKNMKQHFHPIGCETSVCDICLKDYKELEILVKHKILFHKQNPLVCDKCQYINKKGDLQEFKYHKLMHIKNEENQICDNQSEQIND